MVRKISGKHNPPPIKHLIIKNSKITEKEAIANKLAETVLDNSLSKHYSKQFQIIKENRKIQNKSKFKKPRSIQWELLNDRIKTTIEKSHNQAVGPDEVHYNFLKQIPQKSLELLLKTYYNIWTGKQFPKSWNQAMIIPIPKPGKNTSYPENYWSKALTSCLCKTLEKMVNHCLIWYLETNNLISNKQCGYKKKRGCIDHLTNLKSYIREGFIKKRTHHNHLLWFRKSLWYHMEIWCHKRSVWS